MNCQQANLFYVNLIRNLFFGLLLHWLILSMQAKPKSRIYWGLGFFLRLNKDKL